MSGEFRDAIRSRPPLAAVFSLAAGIALGRFSSLDQFTAVFTAITLAGAIYLAGRPLGYFLAFMAMFGAALISLQGRTDPGSALEGVIGKYVSVKARVEALDSERPHNSRMVLRLLELNGRPSTARVLAYPRHDSKAAGAAPGDIFTMEDVRLFAIRGFHNQGGWDYEEYLKDKGIAGRLSIAKKSKIVKAGRGWALKRPFEKARRAAGWKLAKVVKDKEALAVARAMLLGDQGMVTQELRDIFSRAGTAHILAVSGLHIGFVAAVVFFGLYGFFFAALYHMARRLALEGWPSKLAALGTILATGSFALFTGPPVSAFRAAVMICVYMLAVFMGRPREFYAAFATAMALLLLISPSWLFTAGFQLSFSAVFFITVLLERTVNAEKSLPPEKEITRLTPTIWRRIGQRFPLISAAFLMSLFAMAGSGPLAFAHFNIISFIGPAANVPVVLLASAATPLGLVGLLSGSGFLLAVAGWMMQAVIAISYLASKAPLAYAYAPDAPDAVILFTYAALGLILIMERGQKRRLAVALSCLAAGVALAAGAYSNWRQEGLTVRFLDVGQGDSTLLLWPGGAAAIDAGPSHGGFDLGASVTAPALWHKGYTQLDAFFATHGDTDHIGGAMGLLDRIPANRIYGPGVASTGKVMAPLRGWAVVNGLWAPLHRGGVIRFEKGPEIHILNPPAGKPQYRDVENNTALALKVVYGGHSFLLPSDIGAEVEKWLLSSGADLKAEVLKIPHHGSGSSSSEEFLDKVDPRLAVISVGYNNYHGHPDREVARRLNERGLTVFRTDIDGEIIIRASKGRLEAGTFRSGAMRVLYRLQ